MGYKLLIIFIILHNNFDISVTMIIIGRLRNTTCYIILKWVVSHGGEEGKRRF